MRWSTTGTLLEVRLSTRRLSNSTPTTLTAHQWYATDIASIGGREQEALAEINRARQLDPLSVTISRQLADIHIQARRYDEAITICKKLAEENPTFVGAHGSLVDAYRAKRMYPQIIEELKVIARLTGSRKAVEFSSAIERGFRSGGWKSALMKGIEIRKLNAKLATRPLTTSLACTQSWEIKIRLSGGSVLLIRSAMRL
jgi:tetratricopeptide (TPR) repeat protein